MRTLIVGLGNPILGDDGVGWHVAEHVKSQLHNELRIESIEVEVDCLAVGGLSLMERLVGYDLAILIDAFNSGAYPEGAILCFALEELHSGAGMHLSSAHDTTLQTALKVGRSMGAALPERITVVAIEANSVYDFSEELTPPLAAAVPRAVQQVIQLLQPAR